MTDLTETDIPALAERLRQRRQQVVAMLRTRLHNTDDPRELALADSITGLDDPVEADVLADTEIALLGQEMDELRAIDAALRRIAAGSYGRCSNCGSTIALERMRAQPTARMCLSCQEASEKRHGLPERTLL